MVVSLSKTMTIPFADNSPFLAAPTNEISGRRYSDTQLLNGVEGAGYSSSVTVMST
jgi:hypothetical protein